MKVACFTKVDDAEPAKVFECTGFEHNTRTPYQHEVILHHVKTLEGAQTPEEEKVKRHMLIEIDGGDRQAAGPLRYARVVIEAEDSDALVAPAAPTPVDAGTVLLDKAIDGNTGVLPVTQAVGHVADGPSPVAVEQPEPEVQLTDEEKAQMAADAQKAQQAQNGQINSFKPSDPVDPQQFASEQNKQQP